jgi:hypothetical protein
LLTALIAMLSGVFALGFAGAVPIPVPSDRVPPQRAYAQQWEPYSSERIPDEWLSPQEKPKTGWEAWLGELRANLSRAFSVFPASGSNPQEADARGWENPSTLPYDVSDGLPPSEHADAGWRSWLGKAKAYVSRIPDLFPARVPGAGATSPVRTQEERQRWNPVEMKAKSRRASFNR